MTAALWKAIGVSLLGLSLALNTFFMAGGNPAQPLAAPGDEPLPSMGWVENQKEIEEIRKAAEIPNFDDTPAGKAAMRDDEEEKSVYLWKAIEKITGKPAPIHNQNPVGSCVSFGTSRAVEKTLAVQIAMLGDRMEWNSLVEEVVYGGSRVEIGGGVLRGDGSLGVWAAKFVKQYGALPRGIHKVGEKTYDLQKYDPARCRQWGASGVPNDLEPEVKKFPVADIAQVTSWASAKKALRQGYGIAICSSQGFSQTRNANGVAQPQGSWQHCMALDAYHIEPDGKEYGHIENSWGETYHKGPVGWGNPPGSGFWADASVVGRMLSQRDSWAFSGAKGFPSRKINWFAFVRPIDDRHLVLKTPLWRHECFEMSYSLAP